MTVDGGTPSGLSYTFVSPGDPTDDVQFSNDGGSTFITPTIDLAAGVDATVPRINYVRINPKGVLSATAGGPSFTLRLSMRLD